jgi:hypothetical protein
MLLQPFASISGSKLVKPVMLPRCARFSIKPSPTGSKPAGTQSAGCELHPGAHYTVALRRMISGPDATASFA